MRFKTSCGTLSKLRGLLNEIPVNANVPDEELQARLEDIAWRFGEVSDAGERVRERIRLSEVSEALCQILNREHSGVIEAALFILSELKPDDEKSGEFLETLLEDLQGNSVFLMHCATALLFQEEPCRRRLGISNLVNIACNLVEGIECNPFAMEDSAMILKQYVKGEGLKAVRRSILETATEAGILENYRVQRALVVMNRLTAEVGS